MSERLCYYCETGKYNNCWYKQEGTAVVDEYEKETLDTLKLMKEIQNIALLLDARIAAGYAHLEIGRLTNQAKLDGCPNISE